MNQTPPKTDTLDQLNPAAVVTEAGLIVPATAVTKTDEAGRVYQAFDPDGRRRVVLTRDEQKTIDRAIKLLRSHGFGVVVTCQAGNVHSKPDGTGDPEKESCGQVLLNEGRQGRDHGYGCACTRIHFTR